MKKCFFIYFCIFLIACEEKEKLPSPYTGEIIIEKMVTTSEFLLAYPKPNTTSTFLVNIEGVLKKDIVMQIYTPNGDKLLKEKILTAGSYKYITNGGFGDYRLDYYEADNILLKLVPAKGSEETFKLKWTLGG